MAPSARNRSSARAPADAPPGARRRGGPVLSLQRMIGNRATSHLLARTPAQPDHGTVHIGTLPVITILDGNAGDWAAKKNPDTLEVISQMGKHSPELERRAKAKTTIPSLTVITPIVDQSGQYLNSGSVEIEFVNARITGYSVEGDHETWRAVDFEAVHRKTVSHRAGV